MKNFTLLKPLFTQGMLVFLSYFLVIDALIFGFVDDAPSWHFVVVAEVAAIIGYIVAHNFRGANNIVWGFAKKWWEE